MPKKDYFILKVIVFGCTIGITAFFTSRLNFSHTQVISTCIFFGSILGTILFWHFRLGVAFVGIGLLVVTKTIDSAHLIKFASLDVILFLASMMILMGLLREINFFTYLLEKILLVKNLTGKKLFLITAITSAILACFVDEATSIIFMIAFILELCNFFEVSPTPLIITSVMATNVGSSGTVLGNPIGILIATKAGLTFEDFLIWSLPITIVAIFVTIVLIMLFYLKDIRMMDAKIAGYKENMEDFRNLLRVPMTKDVFREMTVFFITLIFIALHHRLENIFDFATNSLLFAIPLISAGLILIWKRGNARRYVEHDVDWWTLVFLCFYLLWQGH